MRSTLAMVLAALVFPMAPGPVSREASTPRPTVERMIRQYYAGVAEEHDQAKAAAVVNQLLSKDFIFTFGNSAESSRGIEAHKQFLTWHHRVGSDQVWTIENLVIDNDSAAVRFRLKWISANTFEGVPATGKPVNTRGMDFFRISDGRLVELYRVFDGRDVFRQLGVSCPPEAPPVTPHP